MTWYKVETRRAIYRTYHVEANSPDDAEKKLSKNWGDYWQVDEWEGSEEVTSDDTEIIEGAEVKQ